LKKKSVLVINGHPDRESFCRALAESYRTGALLAGAEVREIAIGELAFDMNLRFGYRQRMELEPDLVESWEKIQWADHLVWVHPVWWGGFPAVMKGFIDRLFLPGMAFQYRKGSVWWDKFLTGKTARIITTIDQPKWYYRFASGRPGVNQLRKTILHYCGIGPVRVTYIEYVKRSDDRKRGKWLSQVEKLGRSLR